MVTPTVTTELPDWLDAAAASYPHRLALSFGSAQWTFAALRCSVDAAASQLLRERDRGIGRIGVLAANSPGFVFALHAALRVGAELVPLNRRLTVDELAWQIRDARIGLLIADSERYETALAASAGLPVRVVPIVDIEHAAPGGASIAPRQIELSRVAATLYTSGTTARPKGAQLTYGNLWFSAIASALHLGHHLDDVWLAVLPLCHIGGLSILMRGIICGTPVLLHERFDPDRANAAIDDGATLVSLVPTMLQRMLARRGDMPYPPSLRTVLLGGSAAPADLIEKCVRRGIPIAPTYGLTETASQVTTLLPARVAEKSGSSGLPIPGTRLRITSQDGRPLPDGIGQIEVQGPTVFAGYSGRESANSGLRGGWFQTGDVGYLDDDGYLYVVDRRDDQFVSGGENISPAEVERALLQHPDVVDAGVVGVPDETWGARPVAFVVWRGDAASAENALLGHCGRHLARFKVPVRIHAVRELPRTRSGKLLRRRLRDVLIDRLGPACEAGGEARTVD